MDAGRATNEVWRNVGKIPERSAVMVLRPRMLRRLPKLGLAAREFVIFRPRDASVATAQCAKKTRKNREAPRKRSASTTVGNVQSETR